jgi:hypothetical protein
MNILLIIAVVLFVLWLFGFIGGFQLGGLIHILIVLAVILLIIWVVQAILGRR